MQGASVVVSRVVASVVEPVLVDDVVAVALASVAPEVLVALAL